MSGPRQYHNIALIGFMGTGKSSVGQVVASHLRFDFLDTDQVIEQLAGKTINDIFSQDGEPVFRDWERRIVAELATRRETVISTGGGLPVNPANLDSLKAHSLVVCLWTPPDIIWERVRNQTHRPLLKDPDPRAKIRSLLAAREPFYRNADAIVTTELRGVRDVAQHVIHHYQLAISGRQ